MRIYLCSCGTTIKNKTHIVGTCKVFKDDQDVLVEEKRTMDECDMVEFDRLFVDCIEETISTLSERLWPLNDKQEGDKINNQCLRSN